MKDKEEEQQRKTSLEAKSSVNVNTIKTGFKNTPIGEIPEEWEVVKLGDLFEFIKTKSLSRAQLVYQNGTDFYIHYGDIHTTFKYPIVDVENIILPQINSNVNFGESPISYLQEGDLIIADASEDMEGVGECIELKNVNDKKIIGGLHTIVCRDKINKTANGFKTYLLKAPKVLKSLKRIATGASVLGISKGNLVKINLILPPLAEQEKIAEILSTVDGKIELIGQQIQETEALKKGLMQKLLTKGIGHTEFKDSKLGQIPKSWEVKKLAEIAKVNIDSLSNATDVEYEFYYIDLSSVKNGIIEFPTSKTPFISAPSRAKRIIKQGDVIMATVRPNLLGYAYINFEARNYICSTGFAVISNKKNSDGKFIYQCLYSTYIQNQINKLIVGSNYPAINSTDVQHMNIIVPPLPEQEKIAEILGTVDLKLANLSHQKAEYQNLKKGLMQQLLTGRVRVSV